MKGLFVTHNRIGDAVLSTGLLGELIRQHPKLRLTVACGPIAAPIFDAVPNVGEIIAMRKRKASLHWLDLWRKCFPTNWDVLVDLRNSPVSRLLGARRKYIGGSADPSRHRVEHLATIIGVSKVPSPRLWLDNSHFEMARKLLPGNRPILALGPVANWKGKQWKGERFAELANRITGPSSVLQGAPVVILGGPEDRGQTECITKLIQPNQVIDLVGKVDLLTAGAVLRECALFVGNDSGLMHIAAASGVATLGLFGPSREENYAPWGSRSAIVRTQESYDELVSKPGYNHRITGSLMDSLTVDAVEGAAIKLWHKTCRERLA